MQKKKKSSDSVEKKKRRKEPKRGGVREGGVTQSGRGEGQRSWPSVTRSGPSCMPAGG